MDATRLSPYRGNGGGGSVTKRFGGAPVTIRNLEAIDGTPIIDVKPGPASER